MYQISTGIPDGERPAAKGIQLSECSRGRDLPVYGRDLQPSQVLLGLQEGRLGYREECRIQGDILDPRFFDKARCPLILPGIPFIGCQEIRLATNLKEEMKLVLQSVTTPLLAQKAFNKLLAKQ